MNKTTLNETINRIRQNSGMLIFEADINEVDWEKDFQDVSKKCINPNELTSYLNKVVTNSQQKPDDRDKLGLDKPYIHGKAIPFDEEGEIDVNEFIKKITAMPNDILSINAKMAKSSDGSSISVNIGIPALRGLVYDIDGNQFYIVNTCPGAGSCAMICYARRGSYVMFPNVFLNQTKILNLLLNYPDRFEKLLTRELESVALKNPDKEIQFRWNDAGDFFAKKYYDIAISVTNQLVKAGYNIESYAYTKMGDVANIADPNFIMNFSDDANKKETAKVDTESAKISKIVPKELFKDIFLKDGPSYVKDEKGKAMFKDDASKERLKNLISVKYNVPYETLAFNDELPPEQGTEYLYNVIVLPTGDSDIAAQRRDVRISFLLQH